MKNRQMGALGELEYLGQNMTIIKILKGIEQKLRALIFQNTRLMKPSAKRFYIEYRK